MEDEEEEEDADEEEREEDVREERGGSIDGGDKHNCELDPNNNTVQNKKQNKKTVSSID